MYTLFGYLYNHKIEINSAYYISVVIQIASRVGYGYSLETVG